jgi:hypothetical protein
LIGLKELIGMATLEAAVREAIGLLATANVEQDPSHFVHARTVLECALAQDSRKRPEEPGRGRVTS